MISPKLLILLSAVIVASARAATEEDDISKLEKALDQGLPAPGANTAAGAPATGNAAKSATPSTPSTDKAGDLADAAKGADSAAPGGDKKPEAPKSEDAKSDPTAELAKPTPEELAAEQTDKAAAEGFKEGAQPTEAHKDAPPPSDETPEEIRNLEHALKAGGDPNLPASLYEPLEPGGTLRPSERFARIPLKPRMSDLNWKRWAGPMLEKNYKIRRSNTLWGVSERLFGNPYLWPKVWQLNAQIGNPHVIDPGLQLAFSPGNPNAAPTLAFKSFPGASMGDLPLMSTSRKLSMMELLDESLRAQILSSHPPFQYFLLAEYPDVVAKIPKPENPLRIYHDEGEGFTTKLADGDYNIVRVRPLREKFYRGYRVRWLGTLEVRHRRGVVKKAFTEVGMGDEIVRKDFALSPLALHEHRIGSEDREDTHLLPLQDGYETLTSQNMLVGVKFPGVDRGPRIGALMTMTQGQKRLATLLLVDRDRQVGTAWVVESTRELDMASDKFD